MKNTVLQTLTDTQRNFVTAAASLAATSPEAARTSGELPRLSARELGQLLDMGLVRESAGGSFYIYDRAQPAQAAFSPEPTPYPRDERARGRRLVKMIIMILLLAFPILVVILLRLTNSGS